MVDDRPPWARRIANERNVRGWSQAEAVRAMRAHAPTELPGDASLLNYQTSRHRAGRRRLSAPLLCRWRFTGETARAASAGALGHGRLPGSYEELVAAR